MVTKKPATKFPRTRNAEKQDSFAIGVSSSHYWMITGMAQSQEVTRTQVLNEIIEHYIHTVLAKGNTK
jgi:ABC-type dipeptide/oligopeptide/nickel transport system permease component